MKLYEVEKFKFHPLTKQLNEGKHQLLSPTSFLSYCT